MKKSLCTKGQNGLKTMESVETEYVDRAEAEYQVIHDCNTMYRGRFPGDAGVSIFSSFIQDGGAYLSECLQLEQMSETLSMFELVRLGHK